MIEFAMTVDASDFVRRTNEFMGRHVPQIEVWALNRTVADTLEAAR